MNIVLIGMRGSGKTTVGRLLAAKMGKHFIDLDAEITRRAGKTVTQIVNDSGWEGFRDLESEAAREAARRDSAVIATGGGIVTREDNVRALKEHGTLVWLSADPRTLARHISGEPDRPPLTEYGDPVDEIRHVLAARETLYAAAADLRIDTEDRTPSEIMTEIAQNITIGGNH